MGIAAMTEKQVLRDIVDQVVQLVFAKLKGLFPDTEVEERIIVAALLTSQLIIQSALRKIPRFREVLDDAILGDVQVQLRKLIGEKIEFEGAQEGAHNVADSIKGCFYVKQPGIWFWEFIILGAGAKNEDAALDHVPDLIRWAAGTTDDVATELPGWAPSTPADSNNQELDLAAPDSSNSDPKRSRPSRKGK